MPMCDERPDYPFTDQLVGQNSRHHMIPWGELCEFARDHIVTDLNRIQAFLNNLPNATLLDANLGAWGASNGPKNLNGPGGFIDEVFQQNAEALESFAELIAWLPGNLVVGPTNRPNHADPGENFDVFAHQRRVFNDPNYGTLQNDWYSNAFNQKFAVILMLAGNPMLDDSMHANLW